MRRDRKDFTVNQNSAPSNNHHVDPASANSSLIAHIVSSLRALEDADKELTEILVENLLTISPAHDAVEKATDAIERLAVERAKGSD